MNKYKVGDRIVLGILSIDGDGYYIVGSEHYSWWAAPKILDEVVEPISTYTAPLNDKIKRQAAEITRLIAENAELKKDLEYYHTGTDTCDIESARATGHQEAWELAQKVYLLPESGGYNSNELFEIFGTASTDEILRYTYAEAAAKVAEWERNKKEICVGDVVECEEHYGVVVGAGEVYIKGFTSDWTPFQWMKKDCTKTGGHLDLDAWLAQIGGEQEW